MFNNPTKFRSGNNVIAFGVSEVFHVILIRWFVKLLDVFASVEIR